jgi:hypothetical protein
MKRLILVLPMLLVLIACGAGGSKGGDSESGVRALTEGEALEGTIAAVGDLDWYTYEVTAPDTLLQITCSSNTRRPDVELLMSVYQEDEDGKKQRLFAVHAPEEAEAQANLRIDIFIDEPKTVFIAVRDLKDDDASDSEPYYIKVEEAEANDGNENFDQAEELRVDDESACKEDYISTVGDTDCYFFDIAQEGVYVTKVDFNRFNGGSPVNLAVELYDAEGNQRSRLTQGQGEQYYLQHHFEAGTYFLVVEDQGQDDSDPASSFEVCIESMMSGESGVNDTRDDAEILTATEPNVYAIEGSLDYDGDEDWYRLPIGATSTSGLKILHVGFEDDDAANRYQYLVEVQSEDGTTLLSHTYTAGSGEYLTQIKGGNGDHFIRIQAAPQQDAYQSAAYSATITVVDVDDPAETAGSGDEQGNDSVTAADPLSLGVAATGKISFRGDDDWYKVQLSADQLTTPQVLSVYLEAIPEAGQDSYVDYYLRVMRDELNKRVSDTPGADGATRLKTSLLVPAGSDPATYLFKVSDYQGDEGDEFPYTIHVTLNDIPATVPADHSFDTYFREIDEINDPNAENVELENTPLEQPNFQANTDLFDLSSATQSTSGDTTILTFPWIAGYIDYQGDQDWFRMPIDKLNPDDPDSWHYVIHVELVQASSSGADGNDVEFVWKLYRDSNDNGVVIERRTDSYGSFMDLVDIVGDPDPEDTTAYAFDSRTAEKTDGHLWVGNRWGAHDYYISISDFNYINLSNGSDDPVKNELPDDDWSDTAAYYFQVTLEYYPGVSERP